MKAIITWLQTLCESIFALIEFVIKLISDTIYMIGLLVEMIPAIPSFLNWLPPSLFSILVTLVGVMVVFRILGREG